MTTSTDISRRFWNLPQKSGEETIREQIFIDDIIQKAHIERLLLENLSGIHTVFDGGAGYGRFSILLAKRGLKVTHFDISEGMIAKAKEISKREGVADNMTFIHGALEDLSVFGDYQFDMAMSFDAPISYTYPNHEAVIGNLARIASKRLVISVYSRLAYPVHFRYVAELFRQVAKYEPVQCVCEWVCIYSEFIKSKYLHPNKMNHDTQRKFQQLCCPEL